MKTFEIDSIQPLLSDIIEFKRFMGRYYLSNITIKEDSIGQKCWVLTLSDGTGDFNVYCNSQELMSIELKAHSIVHVEAALLQTHGSAYFKCKNLLECNHSHKLGEDLSNLPRSQCPLPKYFDALIVLVSRVQNPYLRSFIRSVLLQKSVGVRYLQCPASLNYHHNYPGGLLRHSVEIAWDILGVGDLNSHEKDIAVVAALLHDIGKTLTLTSSMRRTEIGKLVDHSQLTLEVCSNELKKLESLAPNVANHLRHAWTCYSPKARYGFKPKTQVAKYLQKVDRMNAENDYGEGFIPQFSNVTEVLRETVGG